MAVFRVRPLPKGRQIGRKYRKPKLYSEKITKAHYTDKEKLDMLTDSIKQTKWEQCRLKAIGGHINEADELGFRIRCSQIHILRVWMQVRFLQCPSGDESSIFILSGR